MKAAISKPAGILAVAGCGFIVAIEVHDGGLRIDNANIIKTDIGASNGVIHVIDTVILPN
jgi:uncharacterized surface protein with fasciclin (FAS1) repeats